MIVSELILKLQAVDPKATVVVPARDHSYRDRISVDETTALYSRLSGWTEDHGEGLTPETQYGVRRPVVVIS